MSYERDEPISHVLVRRICECGGEFAFTGLTFTIDPPLLRHRCDTCDAMECFRERYPSVRYVTRDEA